MLLRRRRLTAPHCRAWSCVVGFWLGLQCGATGGSRSGVASWPLPRMPPTWQLNRSTIIMPCNYTGFTSPTSTAGWGIVDFDWSNAKGKGTADGWAKHKPMDCAEMLHQQVAMTTAASPDTTVWVYRNSIKALPWYSSVREKLLDPAYGQWFLDFSNPQAAHVPSCDYNYDPPRCSKKYHDQSQTPGFPHGDGDCSLPGCDVGEGLPVGEYVFNPMAANISVNGQTFLEWFVDDYVFGKTGGGDERVSGFFFDDTFDKRWGPSEMGGANASSDDGAPHPEQVIADLGLNETAVAAYSEAYWQYMSVVYEAVLARGKFSWQQLWTSEAQTKPSDIGGTCVAPLVSRKNCAAALRRLCGAQSPTQSRALMYSFSPGDCDAYPFNSTEVPEFESDLANFLLIRGNYAWLGHAWLGCDKDYTPAPAQPLFHADFGMPLEVCSETVPNASGVFRREWSKATVEMDCATYQPTITLT
eukprot:COSAG05_NODE_2141_length_3486_cov_4.423679_3_plen_471_part_00